MTRGVPPRLLEPRLLVLLSGLGEQDVLKSVPVDERVGGVIFQDVMCDGRLVCVLVLSLLVALEGGWLCYASPRDGCRRRGYNVGCESRISGLHEHYSTKLHRELNI